MKNAAYTEKYKQRWNDCQPLFMVNNLQQTEEYRLSDEYLVCVDNYEGKVNSFNLGGSECRLMDTNGNTIAKWRSIDNNADFYKLIKHSNGKEYLIFRQDLYGYSVLDLKSREIMQFFPEYSLDGGETFIWTDIEYSSKTNVLAVGGCYWACTYSTHLFSFQNPMSERQKFVDLKKCFEDGYDLYDDVDFVKWENGDLHIKRYVVETLTDEIVIIQQNEYLKWLSE